LKERRRKTMKKLISVILALNMIFLSGCWDSRELNELGLVMAVGIDRQKDGRFYTVTAQIAKPSSAAGQGGKSGGGDEPVWLGSAQGETIFEAVRNLAKFSTRRIMWAHNNIIIIGESLAEQDITSVIDFFTMNPELRMKTWVAVAHGDAKAYVSAKTGIENIPGVGLAELFRYNEFPAESIATDMVRFFRDFKSESIQPLVSALNKQSEEDAVAGQKQIELEGSAVFKGTKLIGWASPEETRGLAWLRNEMGNAIIVLSDIGEEKQKLSVELDSTKVKTKAEVTGEIPSIDIEIKTKSDISEIDVPSDMSIDELKDVVKKEAEREIRREITLGLDKVQKEFKSDVLGFGRAVHIANKREWYSGIEEKWDELFPQVTVNISISVEVESATLYQEPIKVEKKKNRGE
jgi:spore germination protein KC